MNTFVSLCLVGSLSLGSFCYAQYMDNDAKKKLIKDLDKLLALNRSAETKVINAAISKLNSAGRDPGKGKGQEPGKERQNRLQFHEGLDGP